MLTLSRRKHSRMMKWTVVPLGLRKLLNMNNVHCAEDVQNASPPKMLVAFEFIKFVGGQVFEALLHHEFLPIHGWLSGRNTWVSVTISANVFYVCLFVVRYELSKLTHNFNNNLRKAFESTVDLTKQYRT